MSSTGDRPGVFATEHARGFFAIALIFPILATLAVVGRIYCRRLKSNRLGLDDWLMIVALFFYYCQAAAQLVGLFVGRWGTHAQYTTQYEQIVGYKLGVFLTIGYAVVITNVRCSLCILFLKIFSIRVYRRLALANLVLNLICGLYSILLSAFRCGPVAKTYNPTVPGSCLSETAVYASIPIFGLVCDIITWALPLPTVWRLHMPRANRIALSLVFCLGLVTVGIGIVRIVADFDIDYEDFTYSATYAASWGYAEAGVGIMAACGPTLRPILDSLLLKFRLHRPPSSLFTKLRKSVSISASTPGGVTPDTASEKDNDNNHLAFTPNSPFQPTGNRAQAAFDPTGMSPYILNDPTISEIVVSREISITRETIIR